MPKKGERATPAQRAALKRGQAKRQAALADVPDDAPRQRDRWRMLLDGRLTVRELDDQEIAKMRVRGRGGQFSGKAPMMPSHLAQQFRAEAIRRAKDKITSAIPMAAAELQRIINDPEAKDSDKIKCLQIILDRGLGKTPETVRIESGDDPWSETLRRVLVDRDVADAARESLDTDADA